MQYLFDPEGMAALREFMRPHTLIALDYDGTLAPIMPRPEQAAMRDSTREALVQLAKRLPVVIITGRSRTDVMGFITGIPVDEVIGSHGIETAGTGGARFLRQVEEWRVLLAQRLQGLPGVEVEDKRHSLSVHYRNAADPEGARQQVAAALADLAGLRVIGGKMVFNLIPHDAPDKGMALLQACSRLGCERAVFIGDDDTDEYAFAIGQPGQVFGIRVGERRDSSAAYFLRSQHEIERTLDLLVSGRRLAEA